jgi:hypothetical protein
MGQGVPLQMVEIAHALRLGGAVRQRGAAWYLAGDDLLHVSATPWGRRSKVRCW